MFKLCGSELSEKYFPHDFSQEHDHHQGLKYEIIIITEKLIPSSQNFCVDRPCGYLL